jgi:hypothetical protein
LKKNVKKEEKNKMADGWANLLILRIIRENLLKSQWLFFKHSTSCSDRSSTALGVLKKMEC